MEACARCARAGLRIEVLPMVGAPWTGAVCVGGGEGVGDRSVALEDRVGGETEMTRCVRRARAEWAARIEGREGCWSEEYIF